MHPKLLMDVIRRQAGTLAKAILEGVMNSVDAKATFCDIQLSTSGVSISDDGSGITELKQIEDFFETFGQPHEESEGKRYGTFRMGRGQMFSFGENTWRTGPFSMYVDIKTLGLDYELKSELSLVQGCDITIALYEKLAPSELAETQRLLERWVLYSPIPVTLNGKLLSKDPALEKWDHVTDEAYITLTDVGSLAVYNLGIHVLDKQGYQLGTGGTIVSRKQLKVNFARNDIQNDCEVWKKIKPFVDQRSRDKLVKKKGLTDDERKRLVDLVSQGEKVPGVEDLRLFTFVNGRTASAKQLCRMAYTHRSRFTFCDKGNRIGDKLLLQKVAIVLSNETLKLFEKKPQSLVDVIYAMMPGWNDSRCKVVDFKTVSKDLKEQYDLIDPDKSTELEKVWLSLVSKSFWRLFSPNVEKHKTPSIVLGESDVALGWTDGETYIAVSRAFLRSLPFNTEGFYRLGHLLMHELCHDESDAGSHVHDHDFYEKYHNESDRIGAFAFTCMQNTVRVFREMDRRISKKTFADLDRIEKVRGDLAKILDKEWPSAVELINETSDVQSGGS